MTIINVCICEKGMSKGEYTSVKQAVGGLDVMLNDDCKDKDALALIKYIAAEAQRTDIHSSYLQSEHR